MSKWLRFVILLSILLGAAFYSTAQVSILTYINYHETIENSDSVRLNILFNIVDSSQQVLQDIKVEEVQIELDDGTQYLTGLDDSELPYYIVLVLDTSGSMTNVFGELRAAAKEIVDSAPDSVQFAVVSFDDEVKRWQDFTNNTGVTESTLDLLAAKQDGGTCLYDAMADAINLAANRQAGRRALLVFTDGVDRTYDGKACSNTPVHQVIQTAQQDISVPIHIIGMDGGADGINYSELDNISTSTGGFAIFGSSSNLGSLFQQTMDNIIKQWFAQVDIYPHAGVRTAIVTPILEGNIRATSSSFTFDVSRDFPRLFNLFVTELTFNRDPNVVNFSINSIGSERASNINVQVIESETGFQIYNQLFPSSQTSFQIYETDLATPPTEGQDYQIVLNGIDASGNRLLLENVIQDFTYPTDNTGVEIETNVSIVGKQSNVNTQTISIDLVSVGKEQIAYLDVQIIDTRSQMTVSGMDQQTNGAPNNITIPIESLVAGVEYQIEVRPFDQDNNLLMSSPAIDTFTTLPVIPRIRPQIVHELGTESVSVELITTNSEVIDILKISLFSKNGTRIYNTEQTITDRFDLDVESLQAGDYRLEIMPLNNFNDEIFTDPISVDFVYAPPDRPFIVTLSDLVRLPIVSGIIFLILIGTIFLFWKTWNNRRQQAKKDEARKKVGGISSKTEFFERDQPFTVSEIPKDFKDRIPKKASKTTQIDFGTHELPVYPKVLSTLSKKLHVNLKVVKADTNLPESTYQIIADEWVIGREGPDLILFNSPEISRPHCRIVYNKFKKRYMIEDLGSVNHTFLNGQKLKKHEPVELKIDKKFNIQLANTILLEVTVVSIQG